MVHSVVVGRILAALFVVLHLGMILGAEHGEYDEEHQAEDERDEGRGAHRHEPARIFLAAAGDAASNSPNDVRQKKGKAAAATAVTAHQAAHAASRPAIHT